MLRRLSIKRFKRLEQIDLDLAPINVFIGSNNSGKSSILQAAHFGVSIAQTAKLIGSVSWRQGVLELSFNPSQLLYTPLTRVEALRTGGLLSEDRAQRIEFNFEDSNGQTCLVGIKRGRNRNLSISLEGRDLGERLQDLQHPYSIYAPGLAGIPKEETYVAMGQIRRFVARGDANLVLRNVLYHLKKLPDQWTKFLDDLNLIFPGLVLNIMFDENVDENLECEVRTSSETALPIDAHGTSLLQVIQILSYVHLFRPEIIILDEPDSHLHPNNQKLLCDVIRKIASDGVQVMLSTHSRHMLDKLRSFSEVVWTSNGEKIEVADKEIVTMLMNLGALDSVDYFSSDQVRYVFATEDSDTTAIKELLSLAGFPEETTQVVSYKGCSKVESAIVLGNFLREKAPNVKFVVHRDRDYLPDQAIESFTKQLDENCINHFITEGNELESYFLNAPHICEIADIRQEDAQSILTSAAEETKQASLEKIINLRTQHAYKERAFGNRQVNHGEISTRAYQDFDQEPLKMSRGKLLLKAVHNKLRQELGRPVSLIKGSDHIELKRLKELLTTLERQ